MQGKRVEIPEGLMNPGEYGKALDGDWWFCTPNGLHGRLSAKVNPPWKITEHEDGTITVSPSILVSSRHELHGEIRWHGYLEKGVWREC